MGSPSLDQTSSLILNRICKNTLKSDRTLLCAGSSTLGAAVAYRTFE